MSDVRYSDEHIDPEAWPEQISVPREIFSLPRPRYFIMQTDGLFILAEPQPLIWPLDLGAQEGDIVDWSIRRPGHISNAEMLFRFQSEIQQLRFIVESAPMLAIPEDGPMGTAIDRLRKSVVPYAFIHPESWVKLTNYSLDSRKFWRLGNSPTKWILTELMPKERMLLTQELMPGVSLT